MGVWKYTGEERKNIHGHWVVHGSTLVNNGRPSVEFELLSEDDKDFMEEVRKTIVGKDKQNTVKDRLGKMNMKDLRVIGNKYNVYDTKKSELVDEILNAVTDMKELIKQIEQLEVS